MHPSQPPQQRPPEPSTGERLTALAGPALRTLSPHALTQLLRSPARRLVLDALFWRVARQLGRSAPADLESTIRCYVSPGAGREPDVYELRLNAGRCQMVRGAGADRPGLTVALDDRELVRLVCRQSTPAQGVFTGRIMVRGDLGRLAGALASAFLPGPRPASERPDL